MASQTQADDSDSSPLALYAFFVLPNHVSIPPGWIRKFFTSTVESQSADDFFALDLFNRFRGSICFHQVEGNFDGQSVSLAFSVMQSAFEWESINISDTRFPTMPATKTVIECMAPLTSRASEHVSDALAECLAMCNLELRTYYAATRFATPVISYHELPMIFPIAIRQLSSENPRNFPKKEEISLFVNDRSSDFRISHPDLSPDQISSLSSSPGYYKDEPYSPLIDIRRELDLVSRGAANIPKAILCGATAEVLLRETIALLIWEDGFSPSKGAEILGESQLRKLITPQLAFRLKGDWDFNGAGTIGRWTTHVAKLRNKSIHAGYAPNDDEIRLALDVFRELEVFVGDRLAESIKSYPHTASMYLGRPGITKRRKTKAFERRLSDDHYPKNIPLSFARWRREMARELSDAPRTGVTERSGLMLVIYANRSEQWWLLDDEFSLCAPCDPPEISPEANANFERVRSDLETLGSQRQHVAIRFERADGHTPTPTGSWIPTALAIPLNEYWRYPASLLPPSRTH